MFAVLRWGQIVNHLLSYPCPDLSVHPSAPAGTEAFPVNGGAA